MIFKIAWRNLARNPRRSILTGLAIAGALALLLCFQGLLDGEINSMVNGTLRTGMGHLQIHRAGFFKNPSMEKLMEDTLGIKKALEGLGARVAFKLESGGLISSEKNTDAALFFGIQPGPERDLNNLYRTVIQGEYLGDTDSLALLVGAEMAGELGVGPGDTVVLLTKTTRLAMGVDRFVIRGVFKTGSQLDRDAIYLPLGAAQDLLETRGVSTASVMFSDLGRAGAGARTLRERLGPDYEVLTIKEFQPVLYYLIQVGSAEGFIVALIVYMMAALGILNTFLMAVMERVREYGLVLALGMRPRRLFATILAEAFLLFLLGGGAGVLLGWGTTLILSHTGIPIPGMEQISREYNLFFGRAIYPFLSPGKALGLVAMVFMMSMASVVPPALKALKLDPARAMRWI